MQNIEDGKQNVTIRITVPIRTRPGDGFVIKESYSPFWKLHPPGAARVIPHEDGLIQIMNVVPNTQELTLRFDPPRGPGLASILGWLLIGGLLLVPPKLGARR